MKFQFIFFILAFCFQVQNAKTQHNPLNHGKLHYFSWFANAELKYFMSNLHV